MVLAVARTEMIDLNVLALSSNGLLTTRSLAVFDPTMTLTDRFEFLRKQYFEEVATVNEGLFYRSGSGRPQGGCGRRGRQRCGGVIEIAGPGYRP
jgi:hypothetical protein